MTPSLFVLETRAYDLVYRASARAEVERRTQLLAEPLTREMLPDHAKQLREVEVIFSGWGAPVMDAAFLAAAPKLRAVFYGAGSVRYFATEALWDRGIVVSSAAVLNAIPVSEYALATILFSLKRGWFHLAQSKRGRDAFVRQSVPGAHGTKVGLVSLGVIGRLVRERLKPFDVEVLAYDPLVGPERAAELSVRLVGLEELFAECEVISLHTPWLKETEGLVTGALVSAMKPNATLINTARGALIREPELIAVLQRRPDLTAVLDVTWPEPPVEGSPLYTLPNVVLTPHIAGSMDRECERMGRAMIEEFDRWVRGEPLQWRVEREQAPQLA
jgi:phosphoglycerate dehydrogenase-like enzyme